MKTVSDEFLLKFLQDHPAGATVRDIADAMNVQGRDRLHIAKRLRELVMVGKLVEVGLGKYGVAPEAGPFAVGRIHVHPSGYGFVEREDGLGTVFVPAKFRSSALDGDRVRLYTWDGFKGTEGRVEDIINRGRAKLTGVLSMKGKSFVFTPDDPRVAGDFGSITVDPGLGKFGDCVVAEIITYPTAVQPEIALKIVKVLGKPNDIATEVAKIIECGDLPQEFSPEALAQARATSDVVTDKDLVDRLDLRDRPFVTIDPETARDFDDAVCIEKGVAGPRVWVAVADVSHYVRPGDALDAEASIRGVSVYLPDRVISMLPKELSAGICSLNPNVDRCAMVVCLDYDTQGNLKHKSFAAAVIRSQARMDYPGVAAALAGDFRGRREMYRPWISTLEELDHLAHLLRDKRRARGMLELEVREPKVVLDADDPHLVRDVVFSKESEAVKNAYQLVEEYMIAANEAVGSIFTEKELPCVWRVHPPPALEKLESLAELFASYGIQFDPEAAGKPLGLAQAMKKLAESEAGRALSVLVLRSMKQAFYDTDNIGHFGLASFTYVHFTSPIRRYPDLLVHRLLKHYLSQQGKPSAGGRTMIPPDVTRLKEMSISSSSHERRAVEVERETVAMYRAFLMRDRITEEFPGRISGVTHFGVFIEIDRPYIEGMIKYEDLGDDIFDFDPVHLRVSGRNTGFELALGDEVVVKVLDASVARRRVDFSLVSPKPATRKRRASKASLPPLADRHGKKPPKGKFPKPAKKPAGRKKRRR